MAKKKSRKIVCSKRQPMTPKGKSLLLRFRTALKNAGLYFEGTGIHIADAKTGHYIRFDCILTNSDDSPLELFAREFREKPVTRAWETSVTDRIKEV